MYRSARVTGAGSLARVEGIEKRRKVLVDVFELHLDSMHEISAVVAVPLESVELAWLSLILDDEADAVAIRPLRRVSFVWGQLACFGFAYDLLGMSGPHFFK